MKKLSALILALMLVLSMAACSSKEKPVDPVEEPEAPVNEDVDAEEEVDADAEEVAAGDWYDFSDIFTTTYYGITEAGEAVALVMTDDQTFAALAVANPDSMESVSFVGTMERLEAEDGTIGYTITDEANGLALTFTADFADDGTALLDLGDLGQMLVTPCDQSEAFDLLNSIDANTEAVA